MKAWMLVLNLGFHVPTTLKPYWAWICSFANPGKCGGAYLWLQSSRGRSRRIVGPRPVGSWSALSRVRMCLFWQPPPSSAILWSLSGFNLPHRPRERQASAWVEWEHQLGFEAATGFTRAPEFAGLARAWRIPTLCFFTPYWTHAVL